MVSSPQAQRAGRQMDQELTQRVIAAVTDLLAEKSLAELTMNDIAVKADTSRPAIYRRWGSIEEIALAALLEMAEEQAPTPKTGNPPDQLRDYILTLAQFVGGKPGEIIAEILGRAQGNPDLMELLRIAYLAPRRTHVEQIIRRGQEAGCFRRDLKVDTILDLYAGPIYFRAFTRHSRFDDEFARDLADKVLTAIRVPRPAQ